MFIDSVLKVYGIALSEELVWIKIIEMVSALEHRLN